MGKEVKKIGIRIIFAWIFSLLFIMAGIVYLFSAFLSGVLYFLAGLILLPPLNKFVKEKYNLEITTWLKILIVLILLVFAGLSLPDNIFSDYSYTGGSINTGNVVNQEIESEKTPNIQTQETNELKIYQFDEKVIVGNFAYTFHGVKEMIYVGSNYFKEYPDGIFWVFDVTIENLGQESETLWDANVKIIDNKNRIFEHDTTAEIYVGDSFTFEQMQPGLPKKGKIIFDVPKDLTGYIEISSDSIWSDEVKYVSWVD